MNAELRAHPGGRASAYLGVDAAGLPALVALDPGNYDLTLSPAGPQVTQEDVMAADLIANAAADYRDTLRRLLLAATPTSRGGDGAGGVPEATVIQHASIRRGSNQRASTCDHPS